MLLFRDHGRAERRLAILITFQSPMRTPHSQSARSRSTSYPLELNAIMQKKKREGKDSATTWTGERKQEAAIKLYRRGHGRVAVAKTFIHRHKYEYRETALQFRRYPGPSSA